MLFPEVELADVGASRMEGDVLQADALEVFQALDDVIGCAGKVGVLEVVPVSVGAHHRLEVRLLLAEALLPIG